MNDEPCSSGLVSSSRKRKQPDADDILIRDGPLSTDPIENEYENLCEDDGSDEEEGETPHAASFLNRSEIKQIYSAQEPATVTKIDGIKITPFNLKEELQEGEFDKAGNFIYKKPPDSGSEEDDTWAESVDWDEVERREEAARAKADSQPKQSDHDRIPSEPTDTPKDKLSCYKSMLRLMKPDERVKRTIKRLGDNLPKRKPVNKNKQKQVDTSNSDQDALAEIRRKLDLMIELAHQRLEDGDVDIYEKTYEDLEEAINA